MSSSSKTQITKPIPTNGDRHTLISEMELRLEIPDQTTILLTLLQGSAEIFGSELTLLTSTTSSSAITNTTTSALGVEQPQPQQLSKQTHVITGPAKFAVFTWHGCVIDIDVEFGKYLGGSYCYTSQETDCNVAYVNTHAQLEAMRDEALGSLLDSNSNSGNNRRGSGGGNSGSSNSYEPPRVLVVGPGDTGKTSLVKVLTSYGEFTSFGNCLVTRVL